MTMFHKTLGTAAALLFLSPGLYAQLTCPASITAGQPGIATGMNPVDVGSGESFQIAGRFCPGAIQGASMLFTITDSKNKAVAAATVLADRTGIASFVVNAGLPTGTYSFSVQGVNVPANTVSSGSGGLSVGGGPYASLVNGQLTFLLQGTTGTGTLHAAHLAVAAGTINTDGQGNITSGVVDLNSPDVSLDNASITGHYTAATQSGISSFTIDTPIGRESFSVNAIAQSNPFVTPPPFTHGFITTRNGGNFVGTGTLLLRTTPVVSPSGEYYTTQLTGETACSSTCVGTGGQVLPLTVTGSVFLPLTNVGRALGYGLFGSLTQGTTEQGFEILSYNYEAYMGTDNNGRAELRMDPSTSTAPGLPTHYVVYLADSDHGFLLSTDSHASARLVFGTLNLQ